MDSAIASMFSVLSFYSIKPSVSITVFDPAAAEYVGGATGANI